MKNYLKSVWDCRYFWFSLVRMDLRIRYRRSVLGVGWSLLHPIAMTVVLCTVFHTLMRVDIRTYGPYIMSGLAFWGYISACTIQGARCFYQGEAYIRQYPAPLAIYPLRTVLGAAFHFLIALSAVLVMYWCLHGFGNVAALHHVILILPLLLLLGWSTCVLAGFANVYFPDTAHLLEIGLQILFYATPIIWHPELLKERGLGWLVDVNPMASILELVRAPILTGQAPPMTAYGVAATTVLLTSVIAVTAISTLQRRVIFHL